MIEADIQRKRDVDEKLGLAPHDAWRLECVQHDPSNPLPCSDADKARYPKGRVVLKVSAELEGDAGAATAEDDDLVAMIRGGAAVGDAGTAPDAN
jgi:hypothetical protein